MNIDPPPSERPAENPEALFDDADWRAERRVENAGVHLDLQTLGTVWPLLLIPIGLVLLLLRALVGDGAWTLWPVLFLALVAAVILIPLRHRATNRLPVDLGAGRVLRGPAKRRFLLWVALTAGAAFVAEELLRGYGVGLVRALLAG